MRVAQLMVTAGVHYASIAMVELARRRDQNDPVTIAQIAKRHDIPAAFLTQMLRSLRGSGYVRSIRGAGGGYRLAVDPASVSLWDIAAAVGQSDGFLVPRPAGDATASASLGDATDPAGELDRCYARAAAAYREVLSSTTLAEVVRRCESRSEAMYFI